VAAQGAPKEIGEALKGEERIRLGSNPHPAPSTRSGSLGIPGMRSVASIAAEPRGVWAAEIAMPPASAAYRPSPTADSPEAGEIVFDWAVSNGFKLLELERRRLSLEEIFVKLTSEGEGR
jgi:ABC-2 type transport system ATP-binding protein